MMVYSYEQSIDMISIIFADHPIIKLEICQNQKYGNYARDEMPSFYSKLLISLKKICFS